MCADSVNHLFQYKNDLIGFYRHRLVCLNHICSLRFVEFGLGLGCRLAKGTVSDAIFI